MGSSGRERLFRPLTGTSTGIFAANKGEFTDGFPAERSNLHSTQLDPTVRFVGRLVNHSLGSGKCSVPADGVNYTRSNNNDTKRGRL